MLLYLLKLFCIHEVFIVSLLGAPPPISTDAVYYCTSNMDACACRAKKDQYPLKPITFLDRTFQVPNNSGLFRYLVCATVEYYSKKWVE